MGAKTVAREEVKDSSLTDSDGRKVALSDLFGKKEDLILIHNMGRSCPYCTMWADGFNGVLEHLEDRAAFVVVSPDAPPVQKQFAKSRDWRFKMVSSKETAFSKDMGFENKQGRSRAWGISFPQGSQRENIPCRQGRIWSR